MPIIKSESKVKQKIKEQQEKERLVSEEAQNRLAEDAFVVNLIKILAFPPHLPLYPLPISRSEVGEQGGGVIS